SGPGPLEEVPLRGRYHPQLSMLAFVDLDVRIPADHPLRIIKPLADRALAGLSPLFDQIYAVGGRPSTPPERLLKASLLIALYSIRSERAFCEELEYLCGCCWRNRRRALRYAGGGGAQQGCRQGGASRSIKEGTCRCSRR